MPAFSASNSHNEVLLSQREKARAHAYQNKTSWEEGLKMASDTVALHWSETIVVFNSLLRSIEEIRSAIAAGNLDDDAAYEAEEELNDYVTLVARLRQSYAELSDGGELSEALVRKLRNFG